VSPEHLATALRDRAGGRRLIKELSAASTPLSREELNTYLIRVGRHEAPVVLLAAWEVGLIDDDLLGQVVGAVWAAAEFPQDCLTRSAWLQMFDAAGYRAGGEYSEPVAVRVYRRAPHRLRRSWSWTADRDRAEWFATNPMRETGLLWVLDAPAESLLCYTGTYERDFVIHTIGLVISAVPDSSLPDRSLDADL
jgi:hypothetical protein